MTCRGANPRDCMADELKADNERLRGLLRRWYDGDTGLEVQMMLLAETAVALGATADQPALAPMGSGQCQPTLTECPACKNDLTKCMAVRATPQPSADR